MSGMSRVHRHQVFGDVGVDDAPGFAIHQRFFQQRHADAVDDAADQLAAGGFGIQDAPAVECADEAADPDFTQVRINPHLGELRAERVHARNASSRRRAAMSRFGFDEPCDCRAPCTAAIGTRRSGPMTKPSRKLQRLARLAMPAGIASASARSLILSTSAWQAACTAGDNAWHRGRPAGNRRMRQTRIAQLETNAMHRHAQRVGRDLGHHRISAGADILRAALHDNVAIPVHAHLGPWPAGGWSDRCWWRTPSQSTCCRRASTGVRLSACPSRTPARLAR